MIVVFDIDGTLCQTSQVDDACWCAMVRDVLGVDSITTDWTAYPHSTDEAIASALIREHLDLEPSRDLLDRMRDRFVELLKEAYAEDPGLFRGTPGAENLLRYLRENNMHVAIATGGWAPSARFKLQKAGLWQEDLSAAFACDAHPREEILSIAIARAAEAAGCDRAALGKVVYVGDGLWDLRAARTMEIGFLGIALGQREEALRAEGASEVMQDFSDIPTFMAALERA